MTKVEAIIQVSKLESVKNSLHEIGIEGMTVLEARGHGRQKGHTEFYRAREYTVDLIPKIKLELVVADLMVEKVVQAISAAARTGKIGDGRFFFRASMRSFAFATTSAVRMLCEAAPARSVDRLNIPPATR